MTVSLDSLYPRTRERLAEWAADPEVVGVVWVGSRSRGYGDIYADDDLDVLLTPTAFARLAPGDSFVVERDPVADPPRLVFDAKMTHMGELRAMVASVFDVDHWRYERAPVLFERDGSVTAAVQAAAIMDAAFRRARIQYGAMDTVVAIARARKTDKRGLRGGTCMLIARGAKALSRVLFALEDRWVPMDHWLEPELRSLADPLGVGPLLIEAVLTSRHEPLQEALDRLQELLVGEGFPLPPGRGKFQVELMHASRAAERAIHGLN